MQLEDITVEVRDANLVRLGMIEPTALDLGVSEVFNNVGSWTLELPSEHPMVEALLQPGSGVIVTGPTDVLTSGSTTKHAFHASKADPGGTVKFEGVSDSVVLADMLSWPDPTNPDVTTQALAHDVRTGPAESLLHAYVDANCGPSAPAARRKARLILGADGGRGQVRTKRPRFPVLGNLLNEIAVADGLGFRVVQRGDFLVFETFAVEDRSDLIRLDIYNNTLTSQDVEVSSPGVTQVIVAGQGEQEDRTFVLRNTPESVAAEGQWGRRIERFVDQRQTNDIGELQKAGDEVLADEGFTAVAVRAVPMDDTTMRFGIDWHLGDRVTVVFNEDEATAIVTGFVLLANSDGVKLGATIGDTTDFDPSAALGKRVDDTQRRVSELERNGSASTFVFGAPDSAGPGYRTVMVPN